MDADELRDLIQERLALVQGRYSPWISPRDRTVAADELQYVLDALHEPDYQFDTYKADIK